jgi:hypothetical protein
MDESFPMLLEALDFFRLIVRTYNVDWRSKQDRRALDESFPMLFGSIGLFSFPRAYENTVFDALETKKASPTEVEEAFIRVIPFGFEPKTYCLEGSCSIQLSYGTKFYVEEKSS